MSRYYHPPFVNEGDSIAIVSTARHIDRTKVEPAIRLFESWGLNVVLGEHIYNQDNQFAGEDQYRAQDLKDAIQDPEIKAIVCSRGGYGTVRVIDLVDDELLLKNRKWIIGYSDITSLHMHMQAVAKCASIHATMPVNISDTPDEKEMQSTASLCRAMFGQDLNYQLSDHRLNIHGEAQGEILGGNLSMIYSMLGSKSCPDWYNAILFIEDLDEYLYHIDRMMMNLKRNKILDKVAGIVVGGMSDMNDNTIPFGLGAEEIIHSHTKNLGIPVYFGFEAGHLSPNLALVMGSRCSIKGGRLNFSLENS